MNVFKKDDGELFVTFNKTYRQDGEWHTTAFLSDRRGDIEDLRDCLFRVP